MRPLLFTTAEDNRRQEEISRRWGGYVSVQNLEVPLELCYENILLFLVAEKVESTELSL